jgi:hypothetical protein
MATNAVNLIASPTLLLFDLKTGGLKLFLATIGKSLLDTKTQIGDGRFEPSKLNHLIEQAIFELTEHGLNIIGRLVHAFLGVRSPWGVLASGSKCWGRSPRRRTALAHNRSDAMNRQQSRGRFRNVGSAVRRTSFIIVRRYNAIVRSRIWKRFERTRESGRQFRARDGVARAPNESNKSNSSSLSPFSEAGGEGGKDGGHAPKDDEQSLGDGAQASAIGATRRRVETVRRRDDERNLH